MTHRDCVSLVLAAAAILGIACTEKPTPTEVPAFVAPTPGPTPIPQPASMSGFVLDYYGGSNEGATVECQSKSTTSVSGGAYDLTGLMSGTWTVTVRWQQQGSVTIQEFGVVLKPGPNQVDFRTSP